MKILLFLTLTAFGCSNINTKVDNQYVIVGSYTENSGINTEKSKGIYLYKMNSKGVLTLLATSPATLNPSYIIVHQNKRWLYAVNEVEHGEISAFYIDTALRKITFINKVSSEGSNPCYITIDNTGKYIMAANYSSGNVGIFPISANGALLNACSIDIHTGNGPVQDRQAGPHAHMITQNNTGFIYSNDLGNDKILLYRFDTLKNKLISLPDAFKATPGSGPRQLIFHSHNKWAYSINELNGTIDAFNVNSDNGILTKMQSINTVTSDKNKVAGSADIHITPSGEYLYASNRNELNNIAMYSVDKLNGTLSLIGFIPSGGKTPRCFGIDESGSFVLIANQNSNEINTFIIDKNTGKLTNTGNKINVSSPTCVRFF